MRLGLKVALLAMLLLPAGAAGSSAATPTVVLGSRAFAGPEGSGWGQAHPSEIFNGGDPSGLVAHIHWSQWGGPTATGEGKNAIFKPGGGYYKRQVNIELRASDLGRCGGRGPLAYRRLAFRVPSHPGGHFGKWQLWSGAKTLCKMI